MMYADWEVVYFRRRGFLLGFFWTGGRSHWSAHSFNTLNVRLLELYLFWDD